MHPASSANTLPIYQLGHPSLRQVATPITNFADPDLQELIEQLLLTMQQGNGVGIAAPQVGVNLALIIVASRPTPRYPHAPTMEPVVMINPQILEHGQAQIKDWEGCLSVPNQRGLVPRYPAIKIAYADRTGVGQELVLQDFVARIFQHEYDHLQGMVFLDRVESEADLISETEYLRLLATSTPQPQQIALSD